MKNIQPCMEFAFDLMIRQIQNDGKFRFLTTPLLKYSSDNGGCRDEIIVSLSNNLRENYGSNVGNCYDNEEYIPNEDYKLYFKPFMKCRGSHLIGNSTMSISCEDIIDCNDEELDFNLTTKSAERYYKLLNYIVGIVHTSMVTNRSSELLRLRYLRRNKLTGNYTYSFDSYGFSYNRLSNSWCSSPIKVYIILGLFRDALSIMLGGNEYGIFDKISEREINRIINQVDIKKARHIVSKIIIPYMDSSGIKGIDNGYEDEVWDNDKEEYHYEYRDDISTWGDEEQNILNCPRIINTLLYSFDHPEVIDNSWITLDYGEGIDWKARELVRKGCISDKI